MYAKEMQRLETENKINAVLIMLPSFMNTFNLRMAEGNESNFKTRLQYIKETSKFFDWISNNKGYKLNNIDDLNKIKSDDILQWKESISKIEKHGKICYASPSTISTKLSAIKKFFECFKELKNNPTEGIKSPKIIDKPIVVLEDDELDTILDNIENGVGSERAKNYQKRYNERDMAIVSLFMCTGIRINALANINIGDIDLKEHKVTVISKRDNVARIEIKDDAYIYLLNYLKKRKEMKLETDALFISNRNERIEEQTIRKMIKKYAKGISKKVTPHTFRRTFGTKIYEETGDIAVASDLLGHKNIETTRRHYVTIKEKKRHEAIERTNLLGHKHFKKVC